MRTRDRWVVCCALAAAVVLGTVAAACASVAPPSTPALDVPAIAVSPQLLDEAVSLTAELIRTRSENPPGGEARVVEVLQARLLAAGIAVDVKPFAGPDRTNLKAVLPGARHDLPPVVLLGHSDVVPADAAEWDKDAAPHDAVVKGLQLVGRGAIDMLSMVALETLTLVALKEAHVVPARDVVLLVTGDEEVEGLGVQRALVDWPEVGRARWALTEGSFVLQGLLRPGEDIVAVAVAEKGLFQFRLTARGPSGHGSTPVADAAPDRLVRAVGRVLARRAALRFTAPTQAMFADLGLARGGVEGAVMANPALMLTLGRGTLEGSPTTLALFQDTCALTRLDAGYKDNVIPAEASATFDCRLLPGTDPHDLRDDVLRLVDDPKVELAVLGALAASGSPSSGGLMDVLRARMKQEVPGAVFMPILTKGATDGRVLRAHGVDTYGFIPVRITGDELDAMHGKNERVRVEELKKGLPRLVDITAAAAALPGAEPPHSTAAAR